MRDERAEARLALLPVEILDQQRGLERERDLRRERVERVEHFLRQDGGRLEDECAPNLVADGQRQEEKRAVCFDVERCMDARRQCRHRNRGHPPDHRLQPSGSLGFDRVARSRIARRDQFDLVLRGQQEPNACPWTDDLARCCNDGFGDAVVPGGGHERNSRTTQGELTPGRPLFVANEAGHTCDDKEEEPRRGADHDEDVAVVNVLGEVDCRRDQARESKLGEPHPRQSIPAGLAGLFQRAHRGMERRAPPKHEVRDPADVVRQLVVIAVDEECIVVGAVSGEQGDDARHEEIEGGCALAGVDGEPDRRCQQQDVPERIGNRYALRKRREP